MLLLLELVMLGGGIYVSITGKLPNALTGKRRTASYEISTNTAHLIGLVMILPLPCSFLTDIVMGFIVGPDSVESLAMFAEAIIVVGAAALATVIYMAARKPVEFDPGQPDDDPHIQIIWR